MALLRTGAGFLAAICLPVLLITTNLRCAVNCLRLYEYGFDKYAVSLDTGMEKEELLRAAGSLIDYFNSKEEPIEVTAVIGGEERELFNQREVTHLRDVKGLIQLSYHLQWIALLYVIVYIGIGLAWKKRAFVPHLAKIVIAGSALAIAIVAAVGVGSLLGFETLFLQFHLLSFSNELWQLDPSRDYLIRMFPQGFFYDATLFLAGATIVEAVVIGGIAGTYWAHKRAKTKSN